MTCICSVNWSVGSHMGFSKEILPTIEESINLGMYTTQFFMGNPKSYNRQRITDKDIKLCKKLLKKFPTNIFSHFPYIANLNGSVKSLAWNGDKTVDAKLSHLIKELEYELDILSNFSCCGKCGVVIHPGAYPKKNEGLDTIAKTINHINFTPNSKLLLENCAGEGNKLCKNFTEIKRIIDGVDSTKKNNVGVCIDTAHIWGQGDYNISKKDEIDRLFYDFNNIIGMEYFTLLHLNDSEVKLGDKKDRHAPICGGYIWKNNSDTLLYLLEKCKQYNIPMVLETTPLDMLTLFNLSS